MEVKSFQLLVGQSCREMDVTSCPPGPVLWWSHCQQTLSTTKNTTPFWNPTKNRIALSFTCFHRCVCLKPPKTIKHPGSFNHGCNLHLPSPTSLRIQVFEVDPWMSGRSEVATTSWPLGALHPSGGGGVGGWSFGGSPMGFSRKLGVEITEMLGFYLLKRKKNTHWSSKELVVGDLLGWMWW